jgi:predicted transcriptional regulator
MSTTTMSDESETLTALTAKVVVAYVAGNNHVSPADLPSLIATIYRTLGSAPDSEVVAPAKTVKATPAQIRKSITPDALISFEDGLGHKMLKRHLTRLGMTATDYKAKWALPADYPTTAANYSAARSVWRDNLDWKSRQSRLERAVEAK